MSVPQKSHQQSVRTTISGEMRSVYTMSPEAPSPAQAYITYYNFLLSWTGQLNQGLQKKEHLQLCCFIWCLKKQEKVKVIVDSDIFWTITYIIVKKKKIDSSWQYVDQLWPKTL